MVLWVARVKGWQLETWARKEGREMGHPTGGMDIILELKVNTED